MDLIFNELQGTLITENVQLHYFKIAFSNFFIPVLILNYDKGGMLFRLGSIVAIGLIKLINGYYGLLSICAN